VGVALMGRKKGDKVIVKAPAGPVSYTVVSVS
jgi:transcription elongation GreA/GreB family factor